MDLVNVTVTRMLANVDHNKFEAYPIVSSTTGYAFIQNVATAVTGTATTEENGGGEPELDGRRLVDGPRAFGKYIDGIALPNRVHQSAVLRRVCGLGRINGR